MSDLSAIVGYHVSRETTDRLQVYAALIKKWNPRINLVAKKTLPDLYTRHIFDSAQVFDFIPQGIRHLVDLGSGGGLPGIVLSILLAETQPYAGITLIESDQRKSVFLRQVIRELSLNAQVLTDRIESVVPQNADIVTARALAPLPDLIALAQRHMADDASAIFLKGAQAAKEVAEARRSYQFDLDQRESVTGAGVVLLLRNLRHV